MKKITVFLRFLLILGGCFVNQALAGGTNSDASEEAAGSPLSTPRRDAEERANAVAAASSMAAASSSAGAPIASSSRISVDDPGLGSRPPTKLINNFIGRFARHLAQMRVLALDGGGVRGAFTAQILCRIEKETGLPICELFQGSITGTSTGSLIALGLVSPDKDGWSGEGPYTADEIVTFYRTQASHMFSGCCAGDNCVRSLQCPVSSASRVGCFFRSILTCCGCCGCFYNCNGVCGPRYTRKALDGELRSLLGTTRQLREAWVPVQTVAYDIGRGGGIFYPSSTDRRTYEYFLCEAGAASSAAPTYFPAAVIGDGSAGRPQRVCIDGGLFENNPVLSAVRQAGATLGNNHDISDFTIVSVGTGHGRAFSDEALQQAGALSWARPAISIAMEGTSAATDLSFSSLFRAGNYFRVQAPLPADLLEMDNSDNIQKLINKANDLCNSTDQSSPFKTLLARLKKENFFIERLQREYGNLADEDFTKILIRFRKLVGITHEETDKNIIELLKSEDHNDGFPTQVQNYFNDTRLLKALSIVFHELEKEVFSAS